MNRLREWFTRLIGRDKPEKTTFSARVIADSISEEGVRLITLVVVFNRFILAEFNTHRMFSRNSASSRAIPFKKQLAMVWRNPYIPIHWGANQSGMQAGAEVSAFKIMLARFAWLRARDCAIIFAWILYKIGIHKQVTNRLLEPFMWHTVVVTATEWENYFALRDNPQAQPEIQVAAAAMRKAIDESTPRQLKKGEWHLPFIQLDEREWAEANPLEAIKVSVGRCARVSYLTHDGVRDFDKDIELFVRLVTSGHMSPCEHVATPADDPTKFSGNFRGWTQYRKTLPNEDNFALAA